MKEVLEALAKYKQGVDEALLVILEKAGERQLSAKTGSFFPTIFDELKHLFGSDVNWIKRLKLALPHNAALARSRFAAYDSDILKALEAKDRVAFFADLRAIDAEIRAIVSELEPDELAKAVTYVNYKGETQTFELWKVLLQWFNHGTHHRGAISCQLDGLGVENDYSSLLAKI
jgi:uncharacterized damage-inducible protein DinB